MVEVMRKDPQPAMILAERFSVEQCLVRRIAHRYGIVLPTTMYLKRKDVKRFSEGCDAWGPSGGIISKGTKNRNATRWKNQ